MLPDGVSNQYDVHGLRGLRFLLISIFLIIYLRNDTLIYILFTVKSTCSDQLNVVSSEMLVCYDLNPLFSFGPRYKDLGFVL